VTLKLAVSRSRPSVPYVANLFVLVSYVSFHFVCTIVGVVCRSVRGVEPPLRRTAVVITWSVNAASLTSAGSVLARGNRMDHPGNVQCYFS